jgi:hypothetical protein
MVLAQSSNNLTKPLEPMNESLLASRMENFLGHKKPVFINISMTCLVHDMISQLYDGHLSSAPDRSFRWSISSASLPNFVHSFIRTKDCFLYTVGGPCLLLELAPCYADSVMTVFAKVYWQFTKTTFPALQSRLSYGEMYRITPRSTRDAFGIISHSGFSAPKDELTYSVTKSPLPLQWDCSQACFHAPVLYKAEVCSIPCSLEIHAFYLPVAHDRVNTKCSRLSCL